MKEIPLSVSRHFWKDLKFGNGDKVHQGFFGKIRNIYGLSALLPSCEFSAKIYIFKIRGGNSFFL